MRCFRRLSLLVLLALSATALSATKVQILRSQSQETFLRGTLEGISVDPLGTLRLADRAERVASIEEPFVFAAAPCRDGFVLGTGNEGKVLLVGRDGSIAELFRTKEPEVFAVWCDPDGTVFAGSSPAGSVYRLPRGATAAEPFFAPEQTYIWALARVGESLWVATGTEGRLFGVAPDGTGRVLFDSEDTHLRSLQPQGNASALVGTAGSGLLLRVQNDGKIETWYDAEPPEIVALTTAPDGSVYLAALASEASLLDLQPRPSEDIEKKKEAEGEKTETPDSTGDSVSVQEGALPTGSRPSGFTGARSEVVRVTPGGTVETVWRFEKETVYDLLWHRDRLWVATGLGGKLYSYQAQQMILEKGVDERQIVALLPDDPGPAFATTNAAALYRLARGTEQSGEFTSEPQSAGQLSRFGTLRWEGELPENTAVEWQGRSGMSSLPDGTWSEWTAAQSGREIALDALPRGRFVQWRVRLKGAGGSTPRIHLVELSYLQMNQKPEITELKVLEPGQILVPATFNPANQVYEPAHPNRDGIFTSIDGKRGDAESSRLKTVWKLGYRTLDWEAKDPNEDRIRYVLEFRREESEAPWFGMAEDLEDSHYSFDATALADGRYRFRVTASDRLDNAPVEALAASRASESVLIDHGHPVLAAVEASGGRLRVRIEDAWSPLSEAVYSVDAGAWHPAPAQDGLLDGRLETLEIEARASSGLLLLRVTDAAYNVVTFDLSANLP